MFRRSIKIKIFISEPESVLSRARGYVPVAPINTGGHVQQYKKAQVSYSSRVSPSAIRKTVVFDVNLYTVISSICFFYCKSV